MHKVAEPKIMKTSFQLAVALVIGMFVGGISIGFYQKKVFQKEWDDMEIEVDMTTHALERSSDTLRVIETMRTLNGLRKGKIDYLITSMELDLALTLCGLSTGYPMETLLTNSKDLKLVTNAVNYMIDYPIKRTGDATVDQTIECAEKWGQLIREKLKEVSP
jgi:hypothetical protein